MQLLKWPVRAVGLAAFWMFCCPSGCSNDSESSGRAEAAPARKGVTEATTVVQATLQIKGMTSGGCAADVPKTLKAVPRVKTAKVDFQEGRAVVVHDSAKSKATDLVKAVNGIAHQGRKGAFQATAKPKSGGKLMQRKGRKNE